MYKILIWKVNLGVEYFFKIDNFVNYDFDKNLRGKGF